MNRYHFWKHTVATAGIALWLAGCAAATSPYATTVHRAPSQQQTLSTNPAASPLPQLGTASTDAPPVDTLVPQTLVKVGLLLPLSGRNAELGKALQDAASVSLFDKYARLGVNQLKTKVELLPKDTGDTPEHAAQAMKEALAEGAQFIIGPLFAEDAAAAAPLAQAKNISMLSFSNTRTQASPATYMFGFSPEQQTERVVTYAIASGKTRIAVLAPNTPLGDAVLASARDAAAKQGVKLAVESRYLLQGGGMDTALNGLVRSGQTPAFDAILIPEGGTTLDTILRGLNTRGVKPSNMKFLGTGLWDDADLLRRVNLDSAWFASSPPALTNKFEQRFLATYAYPPPRVASLAYDAVALAVTLATSGRPFDATALTNPNGFAGPANGIFRLRANGSVQRGLAVMEVQGNTLQVISPPPKGF